MCQEQILKYFQDFAMTDSKIFDNQPPLSLENSYEVSYQSAILLSTLQIQLPLFDLLLQLFWKPILSATTIVCQYLHEHVISETKKIQMKIYFNPFKKIVVSS